MSSKRTVLQFLRPQLHPLPLLSYRSTPRLEHREGASLYTEQDTSMCLQQVLISCCRGGTLSRGAFKLQCYPSGGSRRSRHSRGAPRSFARPVGLPNSTHATTSTTACASCPPVGFASECSARLRCPAAAHSTAASACERISG